MITVNISKAKSIAHEMRRAMRRKEFAPYDEIIARQIPGADAQAAEAARVKIRAHYARMQTNIDAAETLDQIKTAVGI